MTRRIEEEHPELFHYTGIAGLTGILESRELWATHTRFLNDGAELIEFRNYLPQIIRPSVAGALEEVCRSEPRKRALVEKQGGLEASANEIIRAFVDAIYQTTFGVDGRRPFADAYVLSFCTPATERQRDHGLLSQWRGYGKDGGYALVFDSAALSTAIADEAQRWSHFTVFGGDVLYSDAAPDEIRAEFGQTLDVIGSGLGEWLTTGDQRKLDPLYLQFLTVSCRYKHWGFSEEREVRIVTIPPNTDIIAEATRRREVVKEIPIHVRPVNDRRIPTIHLFDDYRASNKNLPIKRIIVGPGGERHERHRRVDEIVRGCGLHVPITVSEIPYIDRSL
jgi:hypothetical protein